MLARPRGRVVKTSPGGRISGHLPPAADDARAAPALVLEDFLTVARQVGVRVKRTPPRVVSGPSLLTGITRCEACGAGLTLRTGKSGRYRYYACAGRTLARLRADLTECEGGLRRLMGGIERGLLDVEDPGLKDRLTGLKARRARLGAEIRHTETAAGPRRRC